MSNRDEQHDRLAELLAEINAECEESSEIDEPQRGASESSFELMTPGQHSSASSVYDNDEPEMNSDEILSNNMEQSVILPPQQSEPNEYFEREERHKNAHEQEHKGVEASASSSHNLQIDSAKPKTVAVEDTANLKLSPETSKPHALSDTMDPKSSENKKNSTTDHSFAKENDLETRNIKREVSTLDSGKADMKPKDRETSAKPDTTATNSPVNPTSLNKDKTAESNRNAHSSDESIPSMSKERSKELSSENFRSVKSITTQKHAPISAESEVSQVEDPITEGLKPGRPKDTKTEGLMTEGLKTESPKTESPKTEGPKAKGLKAESPKPESPKTEGPKTESPKTEGSKTESPKTEGPKAKGPKAESPKPESPKTKGPKTESPETEEDPKMKGPETGNSTRKNQQRESIKKESFTPEGSDKEKSSTAKDMKSDEMNSEQLQFHSPSTETQASEGKHSGTPDKSEVRKNSKISASVETSPLKQDNKASSHSSTNSKKDRIISEEAIEEHDSVLSTDQISETFSPDDITQDPALESTEVGTTRSDATKSIPAMSEAEFESLEATLVGKTLDSKIENDSESASAVPHHPPSSNVSDKQKIDQKAENSDANEASKLSPSETLTTSDVPKSPSSIDVASGKHMQSEEEGSAEKVHHERKSTLYPLSTKKSQDSAQPKKDLLAESGPEETKLDKAVPNESDSKKTERELKETKSEEPETTKSELSESGSIKAESNKPDLIESEGNAPAVNATETIPKTSNENICNEDEPNKAESIHIGQKSHEPDIFENETTQSENQKLDTNKPITCESQTEKSAHNDSNDSVSQIRKSEVQDSEIVGSDVKELKTEKPELSESENSTLTSHNSKIKKSGIGNHEDTLKYSTLNIPGFGSTEKASYIEESAPTDHATKGSEHKQSHSTDDLPNSKIELGEGSGSVIDTDANHECGNSLNEKASKSDTTGGAQNSDDIDSSKKEDVSLKLGGDIDTNVTRKAALETTAEVQEKETIPKSSSSKSLQVDPVEINTNEPPKSSDSSPPFEKALESDIEKSRSSKPNEKTAEPKDPSSMSQKQPEEALAAKDDSNTVYLYMSFASGVRGTMSRYNRAVSILESYDIKFVPVEITMDERAKRQWKYKGANKNKVLPAIFRDDDLKCDYNELLEANEYEDVEGTIFDGL